VFTGPLLGKRLLWQRYSSPEAICHLDESLMGYYTVWLQLEPDDSDMLLYILRNLGF
jgi:hypothetical protein